MGQCTIFRQALTRPRYLVRKTKRRAKGRKLQSKFLTLQRGQKTVSQSVFAHWPGSLVRKGNTHERYSFEISAVAEPVPTGNG